MPNDIFEGTAVLEESKEKWPNWEETDRKKEKVLPKIKKIVKLLLKNTKITFPKTNNFQFLTYNSLN